MPIGGKGRGNHSAYTEQARLRCLQIRMVKLWLPRQLTPQNISSKQFSVLHVHLILPVRMLIA
jgi:hypothetical protein